MESITILPINKHLVESPFNPRKTFSQGGLEELAESIKSQGVMQPIVVRPRGMVGDRMEYQIVFGHRRYRAAKLAGLDQVPAIVRDMDDQQAAIAQTHENSKREDVTAIEEAESFEHLRQEHRLTTDQIAEAVGKSRSYVYGRLKLVKLAPEVRKACLEDDLPAETALEIARLPHHDLQRAALKECRRYKFTAEGKEPDGWLSTRDCAREVRSMFELDLQEAPFDIQDAGLNPERGTCSGCPKRSGNDPAYEGVLDPMICLDQKCHTIKLDAHLAKVLAKARKAGSPVIEVEEAKDLVAYAHSTPRGYVILDSNAYDDESADDEEFSEVTYRQAMKKAGKKAPKPTFISNPHRPGEVLECITTEQADKLLADLGIEDSPDSSSVPAWRRAQDEAEAAEAAEAAAAMAALPPEERALHTNWNQIFDAAFQRAARADRQGGELLFVCRCLIEGAYDLDNRLLDAMGWREEVEAERDAGAASKWEDDEQFAYHKLATCSPAELAKFAVLSALLGLPHRYDSDEVTAEKRALVALYNIDPLDPTAEVQAPAQGASTPSPAARAPKKAKAGAAKTAAPAAKKAKTKKGEKEQTDEAGSAGDRDPNTTDMFEGAAA